MKDEWRKIVIAKYERDKDKWKGNPIVEPEIQKMIEEVRNYKPTAPAK